MPYKDKEKAKECSRKSGRKIRKEHPERFKKRYLRNKTYYDKYRKVYNSVNSALRHQKALNKRLFITEWKQTRGCNDCGTMNALTVDHVNPETKKLKRNGHKVKQMSTLSWKEIPIELEKCECVCARCHRIRTMKQRNKKSDNTNRYIINKFKTFYGCEKCGYNNEEFPMTLDFHHLDPKQKNDKISRYLHTSISELLDEMCKCQVLCANCHEEERGEGTCVK